MPGKTLDNRVRGVRVKMPTGYVIGRSSKGDGKAQLLSASALRGILGSSIIAAQASAGSAITVQDEGSPTSTTVTTLNFTGAGVTASGAGNTATITIPALTVEDEGTTILNGNATIMNFVGAGVTATVGGSGNATITIPGTAGNASLTANHIYVGNATNIATDVAMSGDATIVASGAVTLANTAVTPGTYGSASESAVITVDSKGRITTITEAAIATGTSTALSTAILALTPTAYWYCSETGNVTIPDNGSSGTTLTLQGTRTVGYSPLLGADSTPYLRIDATGSARGNASTMGITPPFSSDWSWFGIVMNLSSLNNGSIFVVEGPTDATSGENRQIGVNKLTQDKQSENHQSGAGVNNIASTAQTGTLQPGASQAWCYICDNTAKTISFYLNGKFQGAVSFGNVATGGGAGNVSTSIGAGPKTAASSIVVGHVAFFYGIKLTNAQQYGLAQAAGLTS